MSPFKLLLTSYCASTLFICILASLSHGSSSLTPLGVCWETEAGSTRVYFAYSNPDQDKNITFGSNNTFLVNRVAQESQKPPENFLEGTQNLSASFSTNLKPTDLLFSWKLFSKVVTINGSSLLQECPTMNVSIFLGCQGSPASDITTAVGSTISTATGIPESNIHVETRILSLGENMVDDFEVVVTIRNDSHYSAFFGAHLIYTLFQAPGNNSFKDELTNSTGSSDITRISIPLDGINFIYPPTGPAPNSPAKSEKRFGTIMGIIVASVVGTVILILITVTIIYKFASPTKLNPAYMTMPEHG